MKIVELFEQLNIPYRRPGQHEHARAGWIQIDCPWCARPDRFRMGFNIAKGYLHCWACGSHRVSPTLCEITGRNIGEINKLTKDLILERVPDEIKTRGKLILPKGLEDELRPGHRRYLEERGFDPDRIQRLWGIKSLGPYGGALKWRLWIPIHFRGECVSWTTRSISDRHGLRYRSAGHNEERINHKHLLYGEDFAGQTVIVVEGPLDVWAIGPGAVAILGTGYTRFQVARLIDFSGRVICMDNEPEGQKRAVDLCRQLSMYEGETHNVVLPYKDACETMKEAPKQIRQLRVRFFNDH